MQSASVCINAHTARRRSRCASSMTSTNGRARSAIARSSLGTNTLLKSMVTAASCRFATRFERLELVEHTDDVREQDRRVVMLRGRVEPGDGPVVVGEPLRHERRLAEAGPTEHEDHRYIGRGAQLVDEPRPMDQPGPSAEPQPLRRFQSRHHVQCSHLQDSPESPFFHNFLGIAQEHQRFPKAVETVETVQQSVGPEPRQRRARFSRYDVDVASRAPTGSLPAPGSSSSVRCWARCSSGSGSSRTSSRLPSRGGPGDPSGGAALVVIAAHRSAKLIEVDRRCSARGGTTRPLRQAGSPLAEREPGGRPRRGAAHGVVLERREHRRSVPRLRASRSRAWRRHRSSLLVEYNVEDIDVGAPITPSG